MANEISWRGVGTGNTNYFTIRNSARQYWSTAGSPAFESLTVANWANYKIAMSEAPASSYFYAGDWPAGVATPGWYYVDLYRQLAGTAAISDTFMATLYGYWNGTKFEIAGGDIVQVGGATQDLPKQAGTKGTDAIFDSFAGIPAAVWAIATSALTTASSIGKKLADWVIGTLTSDYDAAKTAAQEATLTAGLTAGAKEATVSAGFTAGAKDATVSKPGIAQTITPPTDMASQETLEAIGVLIAALPKDSDSVDTGVTRAQMNKFILAMAHGAINIPAAGTYEVKDAAGATLYTITETASGRTIA